jgi:hypothetical protein
MKTTLETTPRLQRLWCVVLLDHIPSNEKLTIQLSVNVFVLTFMTYMVSSIYTLGISGPGSVQEEFGVSLTTGV